MRQRKSPRAQRYDYRSSWCYFVTICTNHRVHYFGEVVDGQMELNALGWWCTQHRQQIPTHYPHVVCDEFICMPNHIHGIIIIDEPVGTQFLASWNIASDISNNIIKRTDKNPSLQYPQFIQSQKSLPLQKPSCASWSLGAIIRGFKIWITKYANTHNIPFARQWRYHDRTNFF